jgi:hypothetical protein
MKTFKEILKEKTLPNFIILVGDNIMANSKDVKEAKEKAKELGDPKGPPSKWASVWQEVKLEKKYGGR